jgi:hypothetical protein
MRSTHFLRSRIAAATVLTLAVAGSVGLAAGPASSADRTVTVAGSLQSELGCSGDWQPDCAATHLDLQPNGTYLKTFTLPAGSYEFKAAINDSWTENYGLGGVADGPNYPLVLRHEVALVFSYDDATHRITVVPAASPPPGPVASDAGIAKNSLRAALTRELFYFVMADRFADGDPSNNTGGLTGDRDVTG